MVFGDLHFYDIIIFAGVAAFLIYRLKNVLGKRTGYQKSNISESSNSDNSPEAVKAKPNLDENIEKLGLAYDSLEDFDHKVFLDGAKMAFESIINSFNQGNKKSLKSLLMPDVYNSFESAIDSGNNNPDYQFYSLVIIGVENVTTEKNLIKITIKFLSEQFKNDDESTITKKQDIWTFEKKINNKNPKWYLSAT